MIKMLLKIVKRLIINLKMLWLIKILIKKYLNKVKFSLRLLNKVYQMNKFNRLRIVKVMDKTRINNKII